MLIVEENHDLPLVRVMIGVRTGAAADRVDRDGLTNFATELMGRGAAGQPRAVLESAFDALGSTLDVVTDLDGAYFELTVLKGKLERALALTADVLLRPDFPALEADKLRRELVAQLDELRDDDGQLARRYFQRAFWDDHPYGRTVLGTAQSLARLEPEDARAWHAQAIRPGQVIFGFAGDLSEGDARRLVERFFPGFADAPPARPPAPPDPPAPRGMHLTLVDKPDRTQSQILLGQPAPRWGTPEFYALQVATTAYGGTFTARLMNEVRSKRGLSYGASARLGQGRGRKALVEHVFPSLEQTPETLELVLRLHRDWVRDGVTPEELAFARSYLASSFAFGIATPEDRLELRMALEQANLPADYPETFPSRIAAVTLEETRAAMRAHLSPEDLRICVVSTAEALLPRLEGAGLTGRMSVEVVRFDEY